MPKWEYKVVELVEELEAAKKKVKGLPERWFKPPHLEDLLNKYGSQGWELVSFEPIIDYKTEDFLVLAVFKRPKK